MQTIWKVASFNINSIRVRMEDFIQWLARENPDVVGLQETKVQDNDFPLAPLSDIGYHVAFRGEKGKNGVAIISREKPAEVCFGLDEWGLPGEARLISARYNGISLINTYVPQGREPGTDYFQYKLQWIKHMKDYFSRHYQPDQPVIWLGDFNVAPEPIDIYDPDRLLGRVGYHPEEHTALAEVKEWGFTDIFRRHIPEKGNYTFWDYRVKNAVDRGLGWRIDHIWATAPLAERSVDAKIDTSLRRLARPSDHTPIIATFSLE
jgi:exodeoxyribonuclease-3